MNNGNIILNELREISPLLAGMDKVNVFTVPNGYFEGLADTLQLLVKEESSTVLNRISKQNQDVPAGYFESLADTILSKIKAEEAKEEFPLLNSITRENVYTVPQGYFESLAGNSLNSIKTQEATAYPILNSISKANVYTVPEGYFETLSAAIVGKTNQPQAKVVGMGKRINWLKYAAAAVFTGIIAFGVFKFTLNDTKFDTTTERGIEIAKQKSFDSELEKVADEDIIKYLQAEGSDVEAALVANTIDEKELPSQEDYLMDEKALDNFLDNADLKDFKN